jgi:phosphate starvation-inducible protein PhoH
MEYAIETLSELDEVSITRFDNNDVVRSKIVSKILDLWE